MMSTLSHRLRYYLRGESSSDPEFDLDLDFNLVRMLHGWAVRAERIAREAGLVVPEVDLIYGAPSIATLEWHGSDRTRFTVFATPADGCSTMLTSYTLAMLDSGIAVRPEEMDAMWLSFLRCCSIAIGAQ